MISFRLPFVGIISGKPFNGRDFNFVVHLASSNWCICILKFLASSSIQCTIPVYLFITIFLWWLIASWHYISTQYMLAKLSACTHTTVCICPRKFNILLFEKASSYFYNFAERSSIKLKKSLILDSEKYTHAFIDSGGGPACIAVHYQLAWSNGCRAWKTWVIINANAHLRRADLQNT